MKIVSSSLFCINIIIESTADLFECIVRYSWAKNSTGTILKVNFEAFSLYVAPESKFLRHATRF